MSTIVTAMKTAKTARRAKTINDWALSTKLAPIMLIAAMPTTITEVKTLSQAAPASSPMNSEVA